MLVLVKSAGCLRGAKPLFQFTPPSPRFIGGKGARGMGLINRLGWLFGEVSWGEGIGSDDRVEASQSLITG